MRKRLITLNRRGGDPITVNPDYIVRVKPLAEGGSEILLSGTNAGEIWHVSESSRVIEREANVE